MLTQRITQDIMKELHKPHFSRPKEQWDPNIPIIYFEETHTDGKEYDVPLVILRTNPCKWFVEGGCVMCNYELLASHTKKITEQSILNQVDYAIAELAPLHELKYLVITSGGSFMDDYEVPHNVRIQIAEKLNKAGLKSLSFESEAKFLLHENKLKEFKGAFKGQISVGIGLESKNDFIRNIMLNKSLTRSLFERTAKKLSNLNYKYYSYVLYGKPFLTELEDIEDTVSTIMYSYRHGVSMSVIEVVNIQPYTLTHYLWERGDYKTASLWGPIEVLRRLPLEIARGISIKNIEADDIEEKPLDFAKTCSKCNDIIIRRIREWNYTRNINIINELLNFPCNCYIEWKKTELSKRSTLTIEERTSKVYFKIMNELGI
ncbi:hypothetical protein CHH78_20080 [Shouchella clausii]|uniref:hypothetical protein n=2 Tax=Shouchella clausii TaxID=79880 RepID=UPI000BA6D0C2|nr:hypothetical protein [Shouchella clausii]MBU8598440.1 hypothetical protein [Shouchella clausii]PAD07428.1 hypothetical protein CHH76_19790 [Shouchella clausii]PAE78627.1 hypothetical protein CHH78_20080 [Shouchella clausii]PAF03474.1 hypothetical protein CHH66_19765 [Shouchella clausii]